VTAGIVLAGGRSSRMGRSKADLEWHGSTLVRRVAGIVGRATGGPVVVVRAPGQALPPLPARIEVVEDAREGRGPLQALAAGFTALMSRAEAAFVASTDLPLLNPAFVRAVVRALDADHDVAFPSVRGTSHPLAAAYSTSMLDAVEELIGADRLRATLLLEGSRVRRLDEAELLADPGVAEHDPALDSVLNLNEPADYEAARSRPPPEIVVRRAGANPRMVRAATLGAAAEALGVALDGGLQVKLGGERVAPDPGEPLAAGDDVSFGR
jgi:molybdenum cofactor guanylyltransferase